MDRSQLAVQFFLDGYNCSQAVTLAFCDLMGLDKHQAARLSGPFGGGMGRMREVCGAVSGMLLVLGSLYGIDEPGNDTAKQALYAQVQDLAGDFRAQIGSILCRDILDNPPSDPNPTPRTAEFYKERPCALVVATAAALMERFLADHPLS